MILGMALPNILGVVLLSGKVCAKLDAYWSEYQAGSFKIYKWSLKAPPIDPVPLEQRGSGPPLGMNASLDAPPRSTSP